MCIYIYTFSSTVLNRPASALKSVPAPISSAPKNEVTTC